ncbi:hypothetical protein V1525DRAFT_390482 [Lipomyces kononenkoae]|uniref:Uncharacterized protein n=1 Tax=Lipomyces kononenkoae TaxID=34357 RepID=A0ACC3SUU7_LIPKO
MPPRRTNLRLRNARSAASEPADTKAVAQNAEAIREELESTSNTEESHGGKLDDYQPEDVLNMTEDEFARYEVLVAQAEQERQRRSTANR